MSDFKGLRRQTLSDSVYEELRSAILIGDIPDGEELNQVTLAKQFDVSRVPVREALRRLQAERLVTGSPYQQYVVTGVAPDALLELLDLRVELEVFAVRRSIELLTPDLVDQAKRMNGDLRRVEEGQLWVAGDVELHALLNGPGTEVARLIREVRDRIRRYLRRIASSPERRREACDEHDRIIEAILAGDAEAATEAMREHVGHTRRMIAQWLAEQQILDEDAVDEA